MSGQVGPNAVVQLFRALENRDRTLCRDFAIRNGALDLLEVPPTRMIDETVPARLFRDLWKALPPALAQEISEEAGCRTADYVIAHRIPGPAKWAMKVLPARLSGRLLLRAIHRNAWTFAGSGTCTVSNRAGLEITLSRTPLLMPGLAWHRAVIERLFSRLVSPRASVALSSRGENRSGEYRFAIRLDGAPTET